MRKRDFVSEADIAEAVRAKIGYRLNQTQLADEIGISRSHLSEFLAGKKKPGAKLLEALGYDPMPHYREKGN